MEMNLTLEGMLKFLDLVMCIRYLECHQSSRVPSRDKFDIQDPCTHYAKSWVSTRVPGTHLAMPTFLSILLK